MTVLAILAVLYTLYFARVLLLPIAFAVLLDFLLSPTVRTLARWRIPCPIGAGLVVLGLIGFLAFGAYQLAGPVQSWADSAPKSLATAQRQLRNVLRPIAKVTRSAEQVESAAGGVSTAPQPREVVVRGASMASRIFGSTQRFLVQSLEVVILLFFLLAGEGLFQGKILTLLPHGPDKIKALHLIRQIESSISSFLLTALVINLAQGAVVAVALHFLGMPNPILWGVLVAVLEFVPYLGALAAVVILGVAGLAAIPDVGQALLVPGVFLLTSLIQANLISPAIMGHRMALNPVAMVIGLSFWFWIWGVPGAFIGVPLLATFKICCDHIDALAPVGALLGRRSPA